MIIVYHGSAIEVSKPLVALSRPNLDFGQGFYVTDLRQQAERWASRIATRRLANPVLNIYEFDVDVVEGGVANDNVIDTVEDYIRGRMSAEASLVELSKHKPNNQFCILNQEIIDKYLHFVESTNIEDQA